MSDSQLFVPLLAPLVKMSTWAPLVVRQPFLNQLSCGICVDDGSLVLLQSFKISNKGHLFGVRRGFWVGGAI